MRVAAAGEVVVVLVHIGDECDGAKVRKRFCFPWRFLSDAMERREGIPWVFLTCLVIEYL